MPDVEAPARLDLMPLVWASPTLIAATVDAAGVIVDANETLRGLAGGDVRGIELPALAAAGQREPLRRWLDELGSSWDTRTWGLVPDAQGIPRDYRVSGIRSPGPSAVIVGERIPLDAVAPALLEVTEALALERRALARERDRLGEVAYTDPLTRLPNRRAFEERLDGHVATGEPFALVLVDADRFKAINDRYGHPVGDEVLRALGSRIAAVARQTDLVARLGGEELGVILPGADEAAAVRWAERARHAVAERPVTDARLPVTISAGVAAWHPGESVRDLLARADRALYRAKAAGRDRVAAGSDRTSVDPPSIDLPLGESSAIGFATVEGLTIRSANPALVALVGMPVTDIPVARLVHPAQAPALEELVRGATGTWTMGRFGLAPDADGVLADHVIWARRSDGVVHLVVEPARAERAAVEQALLALVDDLIDSQRELAAALAAREAAERRIHDLESLVPLCAWCGRIRTGTGEWVPVAIYLREMDREVTHALCGACAQRVDGDA